MITIRIGTEEKDIAQASPDWINQQINRRRDDGQLVCVRVTIREGELNMALSTPTCGPRGGKGRSPTTKEKAIFDLWEKRGLNDASFTGGDLVAFLKQLRL